LKSINGRAALLWQSNRRGASETGVAPQPRRSGISVSVRYGKLEQEPEQAGSPPTLRATRRRDRRRSPISSG